MVFPLRDTLPGERPPLATLGLIAATVVVVAVAEPWDASAAALVHAALALVLLWIFGSTLEDTLGRAAFAGLAAGGAIAAATMLVALGAGSAVAAAAAMAAVSAVAGAYLVLYPRARVLCVSFVPLACTLLELPALALLALWAAQLAALAVAEPAALAVASGGPAAAGHLAAALLGAGAARLLARPKRYAPAPYGVA